VVDGHVDLGERPGWGVEIDEAWVENAEYQCSEAG